MFVLFQVDKWVGDMSQNTVQGRARQIICVSELCRVINILMLEYIILEFQQKCYLHLVKMVKKKIKPTSNWSFEWKTLALFSINVKYNTSKFKTEKLRNTELIQSGKDNKQAVSENSETASEMSERRAWHAKLQVKKCT